MDATEKSRVFAQKEEVIDVRKVKTCFNTLQHPMEILHF